eukprot:CAMPEP_0180422224 /NCGR_PEP_ID=MMETSP1036_2-20121128/3567_1 /TAXON_ID=632150 /ORGANISM="Azadinium spinosum, Strain 3D9" /LENGTH=163 /DNA_ID=CAMNT_0022427535 /DNA_START=130 /DNA_END=621 /DNA_ORIENTATION=-
MRVVPRQGSQQYTIESNPFTLLLCLQQHSIAVRVLREPRVVSSPQCWPKVGELGAGHAGVLCPRAAEVEVTAEHDAAWDITGAGNSSGTYLWQNYIQLPATHVGVLLATFEVHSGDAHRTYFITDVCNKAFPPEVRRQGKPPEMCLQIPSHQYMHTIALHQGL